MIIYKYIPCSKKHLAAIKKNQLWMSLAGDFNDPFDCDHPIVTDMSHEDRLSVIAKIGSCNVEELAEHPDYTKNLIEEVVAGHFKAKLAEVGICCFSKCWDSVAMWSHYAEDHRGVCLGYDATGLIGTTGYNFLPVKYQAKPPLIHAKDIAFNFDEAVDRYVFTKKQEWSREKEIRLVNLRSGKGLVESPLVLRSVIFGLRTKDKDRIEARLRGRAVSFYNIHKKPGTFKLKKVKYVPDSY